MAGHVARMALTWSSRAIALSAARRRSGEYLYLCWNCRARLPFIGLPYCEICGQLAAGAGNFVCSRCRTDAPSFDCARSICRY